MLLGYEGDASEGAAFLALQYFIWKLFEKTPSIWQTYGACQANLPRQPFPEHEIIRVHGLVKEVLQQVDKCEIAVDLAFHLRMLRAKAQDVERALKCVPRDLLVAVLARQLTGYGGKGWPDLTLFKDGGLLLVEVKQRADRFTHRQPSWVRNMQRPLALNAQVLHIA